jgi:hypothetical protein
MTAPALDGTVQAGDHSSLRVAAPVRPPTPLRPRPDQVAGRIAQLIAEVLVRARPAVQLELLATPAVVRWLERRTDPPVLAVAGGVPRPILTSLRISSPRVGAIEACAVIAVGNRRRALAFRLEHVDRGWCCVAAQVG